LFPKQISSFVARILQAFSAQSIKKTAQPFLMKKGSKMEMAEIAS
jgi:hypothetical protein